MANGKAITIGGVGIAVVIVIALVIAILMWYLSSGGICEYGCEPCSGYDALNPVCIMQYQACMSAYMTCQSLTGLLYFVLLGAVVIITIGAFFILMFSLVGKRISFRALLVPAIVLGLFAFLIVLILVDIGIMFIGIIPGVGDAVNIITEPVLEIIKLVIVMIISLLGGATSLMTLAAKK